MDEYLRRCDPSWKLSGRKTVRIYLKARILPAFGRMRTDEIRPEDVAVWFDEASRDRPGRPIAPSKILRAMMFWIGLVGIQKAGQLAAPRG